jgi:outer membrane protein assembly factor BamB
MSVLVDAAGHGFAGADTSGSEWYDYAIVLFDSTVEGHRTIPVDDEIPGAPGVSPDGTVYIGTRDGYLYALRGAPGLADTPWPKYGHDSRNTSCAAGH